MHQPLLLIAALLALTTASLAGPRTIVVAADGGGDFKTINEAVASVPDASAERVIIHIRAGSYDGQTVVPANKSRITFDGDGVDKTFLTFAFNQNEKQPPGVDPKYPGIGVVILGSDFRATNLTFQNTSGDHGQAIALRVDGDRAIIDHCQMLGWQDTLRVDDHRAYFSNCFIAGRVDFIYGNATAVFDHCEIHSRNGGHVTAANTPQDQPFGFVFLDCKLTGDSIAWNPATTNPATTQKAWVTPIADLGRPWRPFACVAFLRCEMGDHIAPIGWTNWRNPANEKTARYAEYKSTGPGAHVDERANWSHQLSDDEAAKYTISTILGGADRWDPASDLQNH